MADQLAGVGATALGVAFQRARESRRGDRLFDDPYAQAFVDHVLSADGRRVLSEAGFGPP